MRRRVQLTTRVVSASMLLAAGTIAQGGLIGHAQSADEGGSDQGTSPAPPPESDTTVPARVVAASDDWAVQESLAPGPQVLPTGGQWSATPPPETTKTLVPSALSSSVTPPVTNITAGNCNYEQVSDRPHPSGNTASVHAWWTTKDTSTCPSQAVATAYLQASYCDSWGCYWVTVAVGPGVAVYPGGGAGKRDNARVTCANSTLVAYRGGADIDLIGQNDPGGITWGPVAEGANALACAPS